MRARQVLVVAAALIALAGCGSGSKDSPEASSGQAATPTAGAGQGVAPAEQAARDKFVAELDAINADLAEKPERAVSRGRDICLDIDQGKTDAQVLRNAKLRFEATDEWAKEIIAAAKTHLCPS
ncbi:DUF732 domain-containing protein [Actinoplanes sp. Pm04-4]|uniref:DUF732 domain-containing protein n=1 Tax=Paractinoplanes pyxinae TaxID=2997416 RepID=A0ABT4B4G2_9ACTN|nr:DUF732 domain-containing protein [Actinoplanes pyxinae]MCY1141374.1 DUF732 domain-containing protein [Actinoplanes pyxinae]